MKLLRKEGEEKKKERKRERLRRQLQSWISSFSYGVAGAYCSISTPYLFAYMRA